jgi:hypothetical protein
VLPTSSRAHEVRPALLELTETAAGHYDVLFKHPLRGEFRLRIEPLFPPECQALDAPTAVATGGALVERWTIDCGEQGLLGKSVAIAGIETTLVDALLVVNWQDDTSLTRLLRPDAPSTVLSLEAAATVPVAAYLRLGIDHLLFGFDHILFVVGLMLFVRRPVELLKVITAFTVAHSITLGLSALDVVRLSQAPVEAIIALSILYLAVELLRDPDRRSEITSRFPWTIAFGFGLLHGFGFAGALAEIGLPKNAVVPALFLFNVGVEVGQLLIVAGGLVLVALLRLTSVSLPQWVLQTPIYFIGTVSSFWFIERMLGMMLR